MDYVPGRHLKEFMKTSPAQEVCDRHGHQIFLAASRMYYRGRTIYADPHPGNFLFMDDGRLGLIDFGCCHRFSDEEWDYSCDIERHSHDGASSDKLLPALLRSVELTEGDDMGEDRLRLVRKHCDGLWEPLQQDEPFDFANSDYIKRGIDTYTEIIRKRYMRSKPVNTWINRNFIGLRLMGYRLGARVNVKRIADAETTVDAG